MQKKQVRTAGEVHGEVICYGGGRYAINDTSPHVPKWLSSVMLSNIVGMTCRNKLAFDEHTHKELKRDSRNLARALLALGMKKGDNLLIMDNFYPGVCAVYAAMRIRAVAVPFFEDATDEILSKFILSQKNDTFLITNNKTAAFAHELCQKTAYKCKSVISVNTKSYKKMRPVELGAEYYDYREMPTIAKIGHRYLRTPWATGETVMLGSSSGTSGEVKFFPYTDYNIISSVLASQVAFDVSLFHGSHDVWAGVVPRQRPYGLLNSALIPSWGRRSVKLLGPDDTVDEIFQSADVVCCAADFAEIVQNELTISGYDLTPTGAEKPITIVMGGAYLAAEESDRFLEFLHRQGFDAKICLGYGISEAAGCISVVSESNYRPGTVGRLVPGTKVWLRKDDGEAYRLGDIGRLWVAGANVIHTYSDENNNKNIFRDDNGEIWVDTGDYMSLHQNGYLVFHYSEKDFYFAETHEKIYPKKAEEVILEIEGVSRCWVLGNAEKKASMAFVSPKKGVDPEQLKQKIIDIIAKTPTKNQDYLSELEIPTYYIMVKDADLQVDKSGKRLKIVKDRLIEMVDFNAPNLK